MTHNIYIYILIMGGISYLIRVLPMTLIRKPLKNQFLQSFLYYVPYVTLAVMTFPAILHATQSPISGVLALVVGVVAAWCVPDCCRSQFFAAQLYLLQSFSCRVIL